MKLVKEILPLDALAAKYEITREEVEAVVTKTVADFLTVKLGSPVWSEIAESGKVVNFYYDQNNRIAALGDGWMDYYKQLREIIEKALRLHQVANEYALFLPMKGTIVDAPVESMCADGSLYARIQEQTTGKDILAFCERRLIPIKRRGMFRVGDTYNFHIYDMVIRQDGMPILDVRLSLQSIQQVEQLLLREIIGLGFDVSGLDLVCLKRVPGLKSVITASPQLPYKIRTTAAHRVGCILQESIRIKHYGRR